MDGSTGPDVTLERLHEVANAFARRDVDGSEFICGNRAVTEWRRTATLKTGERQEWLGCDLYTFRRGLIVMKDTYIKVVA
jgi:hypothetical protein